MLRVYFNVNAHRLSDIEASTKMDETINDSLLICGELHVFE